MTEYSNEGHGLAKKYIDEAIEKIRNESGQPISKEEMKNSMLDPYNRIDFENVIELLYRPISSKLLEAERVRKARKQYQGKGRPITIDKSLVDGSINLEVNMVDEFEDIAQQYDLKDVLFRVSAITKDAVILEILEPTYIVEG